MNDEAYYAGISFAVRALAHEVRRPFTTMDMFLRAVERANGAEIPAEALATCLDVVKKTRVNLNKAIADLALFDPQMTVGRQPCLLPEIVAEAARVLPDGGAYLECNWQHTLPLDADKDKCVRLFSLLMKRLSRGNKAPNAAVLCSNDLVTADGNWIEVSLRRSGDEPSHGSFSGEISDFNVTLCQHIVAAHGGRIDIGPTGSAIVLHLPAS